MNYFILDLPAESEETGNTYPQIDFDNLEEAFKFRHNIFPEYEPFLSAKLEKGAKLTDIVSQASISGHGLIINDKTMKIFDSFQLMEHKFYNCPVKDHNSNIHKYYWMALVQPKLVNIIDFKNSQFYLKKGLKNLGDISLDNFNDYLSKKKELDITTIIKAKKIVLKEHNLDLFKLPLFDPNIYISQSLKTALSDITGIKTKSTFF